MELREIRERYYNTLVENILPFWLDHGLDTTYGGIKTCLDRDGSVLDTDKSVWFQGRALWVFSYAYCNIKKDPRYLEAAKCIVSFIDNHCFDVDGRMFFRVTEDGRPVVKRLRYFFSECFAIIGYAEYAIATNDASYAEKAFNLYNDVNKWIEEGVYVPKMNPETREYKSFASPMIMINVLSNLRTAFPDKADWITHEIRDKISTIERYNYKEELKAVLEDVNIDGSASLDHFEGRIINPGHAIEGSWFILDEAIHEDDAHYREMALKILDWMWDIGWDSEYGGGIIQYRDVLGKSLSEYHQDMKFWWPQCETVIANMMAYQATGDKKYLDRFLLVDEYINKHYVDPVYGEWFGYLHRDNTLATSIKGNIYKGPFHIPRMYMKAIEIMDEIRDLLSTQT